MHALKEFLLGLMIVGPFLASLHESLVHEYLGHAGKKMRKFWRRHARLSWPFVAGWYLHHIIHHSRTYHTYTVQFRDGEAGRQQLDAWVVTHFYKEFDACDLEFVRKVYPPESLLKEIHTADYGRGVASNIAFASTAVPLTVLMFFITPVWFALGVSVPLLILYPAMSNFFHRLMLHVERDQLPARWMRWFVGTAAMKILARYHWMHHEYVNCNYNLFILADLLRLRRRKPTARDLESMADEGLVMTTWSTPSWLNRLKGHA